MSDALKQQVRAGVIALAPVVLAVGFLLHPYADDFTDTAETAADVSSGPLRWAWAHILIFLGVTLIILAVFAIRLHLRNAGEDTWGFWATGLITIGGGTLAGLTGFEGLGGYAVAEAGGPVEAFYEAGEDWTWLFFVGMILFSFGLLALAAAVRSSGVLGPTSTQIVVAALVIGVIANFIPASWASYVISVVAIVVFWLLAVSVWSDTQTAV
ncbi:MAG: hypothetical protein V3V29_05090 [Acidimicrobiia bacterium]